VTASVARGTVRRPLLAVVGVAVGLIVARAVWPELKFDSTSLVLFAIAAAAWAMAYLPISKFKAGDYEIELVQQVDALKQKVSQIETADRVTAELGRKVIAIEAAATARTEHVPAGFETKVMRGDPADAPRFIDNASAGEYLRIVDSPASDREKIARVVELLERLVGEGRLPAAARGAIEGLKQVRDELQSGEIPAHPRVTNSVLDLAWRLIVEVRPQ
jgi:hypothetical protein